MFPATTAKSGFTLVFPDVCKTPMVPAPGVPLPYPNIATTANAAKQSKTQIANKAVATKPSAFSKTQGAEAGTLKGVVSSGNVVNFKHASGAVNFSGKSVERLGESAARNTEIAGLKGMLSQLNGKIQGLQTGDPDEWQAALQEYAVAASALYVTIHGS